MPLSFFETRCTSATCCFADTR